MEKKLDSNGEKVREGWKRSESMMGKEWERHERLGN